MAIVRPRAAQAAVDDATSDEVLEIIKPLCIIIYSLVTVCGYKSVIRFFPHQVSDLEIALSLLEKIQHSSSGTSLRQESTGEMEAQCILLLWLYILVLIPFDLSSVDTSIANSSDVGRDELSPLVLKIMEISKGYLSSAGPMRTISGLLLSRLLTRPDMPKAFNRFVLLSLCFNFYCICHIKMVLNFFCIRYFYCLDMTPIQGFSIGKKLSSIWWRQSLSL